MRAGLERHAAEVTAKTLGLAARAQGAIEGADVEPAKMATGLKSADDKRKDLDEALAQAQVALNTLDLAATTHVVQFHALLDDEVRASYGASDPSFERLAALVDAFGRAGAVRDKFVDALEAARGALVSSALARPMEAAIADATALGSRVLFALDARSAAAPEGGDGAPQGAAAAAAAKPPRDRPPHRYAADDLLFEALDAVDDFGAKVRAAVDARCAPATVLLSRENATRVAGLLAETAADALLDDLQARVAEGGKRARVTALGALQLDRDVRALRAAVAAGLKRPGDDRPDAALNAAVREGLGVAMHAATLLGLEDKREASDVVSKFVMPEDLPPILALRWGDDA